jgi:hypothetical protein
MRRGNMASMGPTKTADTDHVAANLLRLARIEKGLTQRALAAAAGVPHSTVARIGFRRDATHAAVALPAAGRC